MAATNKLTDPAIRNIKPGLKPLRLFDGGGLYLEVSVTGAKLWRWKYRHDGKEKRLSFGQYPDTGLKEARERRGAARKLHAAGVDPGVARKAERASAVDADSGSFEAVAREWVANIHKAKVSEGHAARTLIRFEQDVFPWLGQVRIAELTAAKLLEVLRRVEARGAIESWYSYWPLADGSKVSLHEANLAAPMRYVSEEGVGAKHKAILCREDAIPRLGNLTLVHYGVNRSLQNHAFGAKRTALFEHSNLQLNRALMQRMAWDETTIASRGEELVQAALRIWPGPG